MKKLKQFIAPTIIFSFITVIMFLAAWSGVRMAHHQDNQVSTPKQTSPPGITVQQVSVLQNLTTLSGKTYRNFRVQKVYADGVLIRHEIKPGDLSLAVVKFVDLDSATRKQMGI